MTEQAGVDRRKALKILGSAALAPLAASSLPGLHRLVPAPEPGAPWRPRFLDPEEVDAVAELAERILPATDTPGAKAALVHQYVDWQLSLREPERAQRFREGLVWLDRRARSLHRQPLRALSADRIDDLLAPLAAPDSAEERVGVELFKELKSLTVDGYYRSEIGLAQELGYRGNRHLGAFPGCAHDHAEPPTEPGAGKARE
ncbi:MAG TPA: gluconate 2-dehydrogenase subunit 3 family protein [Thermoanaerobaculia bacterium]|nr:gluconate 2-dehydrogenase subunit 3 family protein [Thermoanaerobaculia bacterium]